MRVVHIQLRGPYTDNWGYQENIIPRCQVRLGDEVYIIAQNQHHVDSGEIVYTDAGRYTLDDGVNVIRIKAHSVLGSAHLGMKLGNYKYYDALTDLDPDLVFVHGVFTGYLSSSQISRYKREHPQVVIVADSHEYGFGLSNPITLRQRIIRFCVRSIVSQVVSNYEAVFCLTPECVSFAKDYFKIPDELLSIMPLGYDDYICDISKRSDIKKSFRLEHELFDTDIVIVHGGKIIPRRRTEVAIQVVKELRKKHSNVKLVVFGGISSDIQESVNKLIDDNTDFVIYLGHQNQEDYIKAFLASDIALFPGAQSALWQEAIGCGLLLVLCKSKTAEFLNRDNNVLICPEEQEEIINTLNIAISNKCYDNEMNPGLERARNYFSYNEMAKKIDQLVLERK